MMMAASMLPRLPRLWRDEQQACRRCAERDGTEASMHLMITLAHGSLRHINDKEK